MSLKSVIVFIFLSGFSISESFACIEADDGKNKLFYSGADQKNSKNKMENNEEFTVLKNSPSNPEELLDNFQSAIEYGYLTKQRFFSVQTLETFSGGAATVGPPRCKEHSLEILGGIRGLSDILINTKKFFGLFISIKFSKNIVTNEIESDVAIPGFSADHRITIELVDKIFGKNAEKHISLNPTLLTNDDVARIIRNAPPGAAAPHVGFQAPITHELGGKKIDYKSVRALIHTSVTILTSPSGEVTGIVIKSRE